MTKLKYCMLTLVPLLSTQFMAESPDTPESIDHLLCQYAQDNGFKAKLYWAQSSSDYEFVIQECKSHDSAGRKATTVVFKTEGWARFTCYEDQHRRNYIESDNEDSYFMLENGIKAYFSFETPKIDRYTPEIIKNNNFYKFNYNVKDKTCDMSTDDGYLDTIEFRIRLKSISM